MPSLLSLEMALSLFTSGSNPFHLAICGDLFYAKLHARPKSGQPDALDLSDSSGKSLERYSPLHAAQGPANRPPGRSSDGDILVCGRREEGFWAGQLY